MILVSASSNSNSKFRNTASTCILTKEFHSRVFKKTLIPLETAIATFLSNFSAQSLFTWSFIKCMHSYIKLKIICIIMASFLYY